MQREKQSGLDQFATIERTIGPAKLERKDRISSVTVSSEVARSSAGYSGCRDTSIGGKRSITCRYDHFLRRQYETTGRCVRKYGYGIDRFHHIRLPDHGGIV